jgi:hypothetical protein
MKSLTALHYAAAGLALVTLASCGANTQLTSAWSEPRAAGGTFQKIAVLGIAPTDAGRRLYEDTFVRELQRYGVQGVPTYTVFTGDKIDKEAGAAKLREMGCDGVVVTRIVDKQTVQTYYPPTYTMVAPPPSYYGGWYGYYNMGYSYASSPGYTTTSQDVRIETNLYDLQSDKLAWTGLTESFVDVGAGQTIVAPLVGILTEDMAKKKLIPAVK